CPVRPDVLAPHLEIVEQSAREVGTDRLDERGYLARVENVTSFALDDVIRQRSDVGNDHRQTLRVGQSYDAGLIYPPIRQDGDIGRPEKVPDFIIGKVPNVLVDSAGHMEIVDERFDCRPIRLTTLIPYSAGNDHRESLVVLDE